MGIQFRGATLAPLQQLTVSAPSGALIAVIGEDGSGQRQLLRLATGKAHPTAGEVQAPNPVHYFGPMDELIFDRAAGIAIDHTLAGCDAIARAHAAIAMERLRRNGATILLASHELDLVQQLADEVWWLHDGRLHAKGDPREVLDLYRTHIAHALRALGNGASEALNPSLRRGDGRAELLEIATLGANGQPTAAVESGEQTTVRVQVRFHAPVADPVVGIMIRTRIGTEVYGTNTELERLPLGPVKEGQTIEVSFQFECRLCPNDYTITAASHDPDGVWHDWMEDALAFSVTAGRYTAGVANLAANVTARSI